MIETSESSAGGSRLEALKRVPLFAGLPRDALEQLAGVSEGRVAESGDFICRRGEVDRDLFVVLEGTAEIVRAGRTVATARPGELLGELAFLDDQPRSADVIATTPMRLLVLPAEALDRLLDAHTSLARALLRVMAGRMREASSRQMRAEQLVRALRERGHVLADLDPLGFHRNDPADYPELSPAHYGLADTDLAFPVEMLLGATPVTQPLGTLVKHLRGVYCDAIGVQYMHIDDLEVQGWLRERLEDPFHHPPLDREAQLRILERLTAAEIFERFLQQTFSRAKRFSLEGAETLIPLLDQAIERASARGVEDVVIGMAHRGRLNVLANVLGKPAPQVFREFETLETGDRAPQSLPGGDVRYHQGFSTERLSSDGRPIRVSLCFNPSHLEFISPVVLGQVRALQERLGDDSGRRVLPLVIHGDAAFAGQGVVQELFNLSQLPGYRTGGALHVVVNNQIGFTTPPEQGRSTQYATDVARMLQIPIFHVNGERPEAVDRVVRLALEFRQTFGRDVVIDMYCYRLHGHNEGDEPAFTQPLLYQAIAEREPIRTSFSRNLVRLGDVSGEEAEEIADRSRARLEEALAAAKADASALEIASPVESTEAPVLNTVGRDELTEWLTRLATLPDGFDAHPRLERLLTARRAMAAGRRPVDWGTAEALAFASLLSAGVAVRLTGQDSERGTFAHRHAVIHDQTTDRAITPLATIASDQAPFTVANSPLSEIGTLGFEFGYSLGRGRSLVLWEAQFGDFVNVAQVIIDQFLSASAVKWGQRSGLCLLLPHGYEGQGPEHSSARIERFLQLAADNNYRVAQPTTAAQLFHLLREQAAAAERRPLILFTPKRLLQHPSLASPLDDLAEGSFSPLRDLTPPTNTGNVRRVVLCSGQLALTLARELDRGGDIGLLTLEQLYPFPAAELEAALSSYDAADTLVLAQEEPCNMGIQAYARRRIEDLQLGVDLRFAARPESASPAGGSVETHEREQAELLETILGASR